MGVSQRHQHEARDLVWWEMEESMFWATILIGILHKRHMMNYKGTKYSKNDLSSFYPFQNIMWENFCGFSQLMWK